MDFARLLELGRRICIALLLFGAISIGLIWISLSGLDIEDSGVLTLVPFFIAVDGCWEVFLSPPFLAFLNFSSFGLVVSGIRRNERWEGGG